MLLKVLLSVTSVYFVFNPDAPILLITSMLDRPIFDFICYNGKKIVDAVIVVAPIIVVGVLSGAGIKRFLPRKSSQPVSSPF